VQDDYEDIALELRESDPIDSIALLRQNQVDVALMHRPDDAHPGDEFAAVKLYDDPVYLLSTTPNDAVANHRDSSWIAGCDRCQAGIEAVCLAAGFQPRISLRTEDINVQASFVAAGLGVITMPGTALRSLDMTRLAATPLPGMSRRVWAVARTSDGAGIAHAFIKATATAAAAAGLNRPGRITSPSKEAHRSKMVEARVDE
jgi:DNA-binding transcriptional LysR family regulator